MKRLKTIKEGDDEEEIKDMPLIEIKDCDSDDAESNNDKPHIEKMLSAPPKTS